ncbi:MAG: thioredoxin family protein [Caldiserica bacterium]|jgi:glutaredoxin-like protein|nr:thioredoxin family protein [Caldisericota bacterium]MDH7562473.1 thioredoxin family protein [Caldisericota bacterium]
MTMISEKDKELIKRKLDAELKDPVKIVHFTQSKAGIVLPESFTVPPCPYCKEALELINEVSKLSEKIQLEVHDWYEEEERTKYDVSLLPATIIRNEEKDFGIRFFGVISGYEFATLLETMTMVSRGTTKLSDKGKSRIKNEIKNPVDIKVFITPTCPYCPSAVLLAHQIAFESPLVRSSMIEAIEFPDLSNRFQVYSVPKTVINDLYSFEGALPEGPFIDQVIKAQEGKK